MTYEQYVSQYGDNIDGTFLFAIVRNKDGSTVTIHFDDKKVQEYAAHQLERILPTLKTEATPSE